MSSACSKSWSVDIILLLKISRTQNNKEVIISKQIIIQLKNFTPTTEYENDI